MPIYTQTVVNNNATPTTNFTITAGPAGSSTTVASATRVTMAYTAGAVGDLVVFYAGGLSPSATVTSTKANLWTKIVAFTPGGSFFNFGTVTIWTGVVTATGADTITVSSANSGSNSNDEFYMFVQQFVSATTPSTWTAGAAVSASSQPSGSSWPFPVPAGLPLNGASSGFLYAGILFTGFTSSYTPPSGYTALSINNNTDDSGVVVTSNPGITTTAAPGSVGVSPADFYEAVGVYIGSYPVASGATSANLNVSPVPMGKSWVVSQLGFECIPTTAVTTAVATVQLNGRLLFGNTNANGGYIQGPPYITISAGDALTIMVTGLPTSTSVIVNVYYNEYVAGQVPNASNTV